MRPRNEHILLVRRLSASQRKAKLIPVAVVAAFCYCDAVYEPFATKFTRTNKRKSERMQILIEEI